MELYKHKKTGKLYSLVTRNFMFKDLIENVNDVHLKASLIGMGVKLHWRKGLVLYMAQYDNPDGKFFARLPEDFDANFEKVDLQGSNLTVELAVQLLTENPYIEGFSNCEKAEEWLRNKLLNRG